MSNNRDMTRAFTPPYYDGQNLEDLHPEEIYVEDELAGTVVYIGKVNLQHTWQADIPEGGSKWASKHEAIAWVKKQHKENNK